MSEILIFSVKINNGGILKKGYCHICQEYKDLTFEHIPPHKAFNYISARSIEGDEVLKLMTDDQK